MPTWRRDDAAPMNAWWATVREQRWFHDDRGRLVIAQRPNLPIVVWVIARLVELLAGDGRLARLGDAVGFGALFTWAWLEVADGDARIRRVLGAVVLVAIVAGRVRR